MIRKALLAASAITIISLSAITLWLTRGTPSQESEVAVIEASPAAGKAAIGGEFTLTDQNGKTVHSSELKGKYQLVYFGFTHCPDMCPTSLSAITNVLNALEGKASQIIPVFITVDPERDTVAVMKDYVQNFHPSFLALTGTEAQIKQAADAYKVYYSAHAAKQHDHSSHASMPDTHEDIPEDYQVDHSGFIYFMDREGNYLAHFRHDDPESKIIETVRPYLK